VASDALKELLLAMADDELLLGHRDGEWTGHAPIIEEDIAFSNLAQDEIGHALLWYQLRHNLGGEDPDHLAFLRGPEAFRCCHLVEQPKGDWAFTIVRQFLFDAAEQVRLESLVRSSYTPLAEAAGKVRPEESYHWMHLHSWVERLGDATAESHRRMTAALASAFPLAFGLFEPLAAEEQLVRDGVFAGNAALLAQWLDLVVPVLTQSGLQPPAPQPQSGYGGRRGQHTPALAQALADLQVVRRLIPQAAW